MYSNWNLLRIAIAGIVFIASAACGQRARVAPSSAVVPSAAEDSALAVRRFVQGFYDWYTPIALSDHRGPAWWSVLSSPVPYLDHDLAAAIRADSVARVAEPITRETLNFDPFLFSQDPCGPNEVMDVRRAGDSFRVPIRMCTSSGAWVVVEVGFVDGGMTVLNVRSVNGDDIKSLLCKYAKEDARRDKRPRVGC